MSLFQLLFVLTKAIQVHKFFFGPWWVLHWPSLLNVGLKVQLKSEMKVKEHERCGDDNGQGNPGPECQVEKTDE